MTAGQNHSDWLTPAEQEAEGERLRRIAAAEEIREWGQRREERQRQAEAARERRNADPEAVSRINLNRLTG